MALRINLLICCFAGCIVSLLLSLLLLLKYQSMAMVFLSTILVPALFCWFGGLRRKDTLIMIAVFATIGWLAGILLSPAIARSPQVINFFNANAALPLVGFEQVILSTILGTIFLLLDGHVLQVPCKLVHQAKRSLEGRST